MTDHSTKHCIATAFRMAQAIFNLDHGRINASTGSTDVRPLLDVDGSPVRTKEEMEKALVDAFAAADPTEAARFLTAAPLARINMVWSAMCAPPEAVMVPLGERAPFVQDIVVARVFENSGLAQYLGSDTGP